MIALVLSAVKKRKYLHCCSTLQANVGQALKRNSTLAAYQS
jgi:hypothetical protein